MRRHPLPEVHGTPTHRLAYGVAVRLVVLARPGTVGDEVTELPAATGRAVVEAAAVGAVVAMVVTRACVTDEVREVVTATLESLVDEASEDVVTLALDMTEETIAALLGTEVAA